MADSRFAQYAGFVRFPRTPADLTTTSNCPACFAAIASATCPECALDLTSPLAARLARESADAAAALDRRLETIGRIRFESARREAPTVPVIAPATAPDPAPAPPPPAAEGPRPERPEPRPPRRSSVQVVLLAVGVSLLSIAAIFFLVYAFINFGMIWRSVIIAAITAAAFATASILRRRKLTATAEGIAVFAVVLVYLDAFAVRANDLFDASQADGLTYWGATLLVSAVAFLGWNRVTALRAASIAAASVLVPGAALLVAGLLRHGDFFTVPFAPAAAAAAVGLLHPIARRAAERTIVRSLASIAFVVAYAASWVVATDSQWAPTIAQGVLAVIGLGHAAVAAQSRLPRWRAAFSAAAAVCAATAVGAGVLRGNDPALSILVPVVAAAVVAMSLDIARQRVAAAAAALVTAIAFVPTAVVAVVLASSASTGHAVWSLGPADRVVTLYGFERTAVLAAALVVAIAAVGSRATKHLESRAVPLAAVAGAVALLAVPLLESVAVVAGGWLLLAALALALAFWRPRLRVPLAAVAGVSALLGYAVGWASEDTWLAASAGLVVLLLAARRLVPRAARAALLGVAVIVALIAANAEGRTLGTPLDGLIGVGMLGVTLAAVALVRRFDGLDRRVTFWIATPLAVVAVGFCDRPSVAAICIGVALSACLGGWATTGFSPERIVAAIAVTPVLALAVGAFDLSSSAVVAVVMAGALAVAALGLVGATLVPSGVPRWAGELGVAIVAVSGVGWSLARYTDLTWLTLELAAATVLVVAVSRDGLLASASPRKYLGWLALVSATAGLWIRLGQGGVTAVEPYVLPLAAVLGGLALLLWRAGSASATSLTFAALLIAVEPVAIAGGTGSDSRAVVIAAVASALLVGGAWLVGTDRSRRYLDAAGIVGAIGVLSVSLGRIGLDGAHADTWMLAALAVFGLASFGPAVRGRPGAASALLLVALGVVLVGSLGHLGEVGVDRRLYAALALFCAVHPVAVLLARPPLARLVAWVAIGFASVIALVGALAGVLSPLESASVPVAASLLLGGSVTLARRGTSSWPTLAPGLLVLLVPSLAATIGDRPVWRLVGIGVLAIAAIVVGAVRRLQAPFVLGTAVVLLHAAATFAPQIRAVYLAVPWWLWAGVGGLLLIVLAARYEHRIRNLRSAVGKLSALR